MKKVWAALLALLMMGAALCGCSHPRVEFDTVRITHEYLEGERLGTMSVPVSQVSIEISDFEIMDELWDLYTDLEILHNNSLGLLFFPGAGPNPPPWISLVIALSFFTQEKLSVPGQSIIVV